MGRIGRPFSGGLRWSPACTDAPRTNSRALAGAMAVITDAPECAWRAYQQQVADVASAIAHRIIGGVKVNSVKLDVPVDVGIPHPRCTDVLVEAGVHGIVIEYKRFSRRLGKDVILPRLIDFIDICLANPDRKWTFCLVAATDVPRAAREPVTTLTRAGLTIPNFENGTLAASSHFVFYRPVSIDVGILLDEETVVGGIILPDVADILSQHDVLMHASLPLTARATAGLRLAQRDLRRTGFDAETATALIHGLLHLGMVQEAHYLLRHWHTLRPPTASAYVDELMARYQIGRLYAGRRAKVVRRFCSRCCACWRRPNRAYSCRLRHSPRTVVMRE